MVGSGCSWMMGKAESTEVAFNAASATESRPIANLFHEKRGSRVMMGGPMHSHVTVWAEAIFSTPL